MTPAGFPHSDIHGSILACSSPWLFAAYRVLLRLMAPRHPPYALSSLTLRKISSFGSFCVSSCSLARHTISIVFAAQPYASLNLPKICDFPLLKKIIAYFSSLSRENLVLLLHFPLCQITKEHCCMFLSFLTR
jgi:hypothetical protein